MALLWNQIALTPKRLDLRWSPSNLSAEADGGYSNINLTWVDNSADEDGFSIECDDGGGGGFVEIDTVAAGVTTYQHTGLTPGNTYTYRVRAYKGMGPTYSAYSNTDSAAPFDLWNDVAWKIAMDADTDVYQSNGGAASGNGDDVGYWVDQSGNNNHANQATADNKPHLITAQINGHSVVRFTQASSHYMTISDSASLAATGDVTMIVVAKSTDNGAILYKGSSTSNREYSLAVDAPGRVNGNVFHNGSSGTKSSAFSDGGYNDAYHVISYRYDDSLDYSTLRVDGMPVGFKDNVAVRMTNQASNLEVGRYGGGSLYLGGDIACIFLILTPLTDAVLWQVEDALAEYYDLSYTEIQATFFGGRFAKSASNPILEAVADWEVAGIRDPRLLMNPDGTIAQESGNYLMYYYGRSAVGVKSTGLATSADFVSWTKYGSNPVLSDYTLSCVIKLGAGNYIGYGSHDSANDVSYWTSADGLAWAYGDILIEDSDFTGVTEVHLPWVVQIDGTWYMILEGLTASGFRLFMASSADPDENWSAMNGGGAVYTTAAGWDNYAQANPALYELDTNKYILVYNGEAAANTWHVGMLTSTDLTTWTRTENAPLIVRGGPGTWDDQRLEGGVLLLDDILDSKSVVRMLYFGLPTTSSITDGKIGYASCEQP